MPLNQDNWFPAGGLETRIDPFSFNGDFVQKILVTLDLRTARSADLHERKTALICRVQLQKPLYTAEAFDYAFGVIDAVDSNAKQTSFYAQLFAQRGALRSGTASRFVLRRDFGEGHADGVRAHARDMALAVNGEPVPFGERLNRAVNCFQKIVAMRLNMETDEVSSQKAVDEFALPRADAEGFRIGPGYVPEDGDTRVRPCFFDHSWKQSKVVVLYEKQWRFRAFHFSEDGVGEAAVNLLVVKPVLRPKYRTCMRDVTEWPKTLVGKASVVASLFFVAKPNAPERIGRMIWRDSEAIMRVHHFPVGATGAVSDPCAVARKKDRFERSDDTARGNDHVYRSVSFIKDVHVRLAIRDNE